jgi:hypothetical protein
MEIETMSEEVKYTVTQVDPLTIPVEAIERENRTAAKGKRGT